MDVVLIFGAILVVVFVATFISARRFGPLALALAAGALLSGLWADWLAEQLDGFGIGLPWLPVGVLAAIILILLPLVVLLLSGPRYYNRLERFLSALSIGVMTAAFLVEPLGEFMTLEGDALTVYEYLVDSWHYVVTIGLILGVIDLFLIHTSKHGGSGKKH